MGDVEDPELYAAEPLLRWRQTDYGSWCVEHSLEQMTFSCIPDYDTYGYKCVVWGQLTPEDYTFHQLKWSNYVDFNRK